MAVRTHRSRRRGATAVETALVLVPLLMFVFGIIEYGRFLMDLNLLHNSGEGCRYALANNTSTTISTDVQTTVTTFMAGQQKDFSNFTVTVSGTHAGTATAVNNLVAGDMITVTVSGKYKFMNVIPLVSLPTSLSVNSAVTMVCEGAM